MENSFRICLGSNSTDAEENIASAVRFLTGKSILIKTTPCYHTPSEGNPAAPDYVNMLVEGCTSLSFEEFERWTKEYETHLRVNEGLVPPFISIDIDIVEFNNSVMRQADASSYHYRLGLELLGKEIKNADC